MPSAPGLAFRDPIDAYEVPGTACNDQEFQSLNGVDLFWTRERSVSSPKTLVPESNDSPSFFFLGDVGTEGGMYVERRVSVAELPHRRRSRKSRLTKRPCSPRRSPEDSATFESPGSSSGLPSTGMVVLEATRSSSPSKGHIVVPKLALPLPSAEAKLEIPKAKDNDSNESPSRPDPDSLVSFWSLMDRENYQASSTSASARSNPTGDGSHAEGSHSDLLHRAPDVIEEQQTHVIARKPDHALENGGIDASHNDATNDGRAACIGSVRVLLVAPSSSADMDVFHVEKLCQRCEIQDLTIVRSQQVGQVAAAAAARCQRDDTLVICTIGTFQSPQTDSRTDFLSLVCAAAPPRISIVCIADDAEDLLDINLSGRMQICAEGRSIIVISACREIARPGLVVRSMLRAAESLSLADGPCLLHCGDVFKEMCEQVCDYTGNPQDFTDHNLKLLALPEEETARKVRWPLAAMPQNWQKGASKIAMLPTPAATPYDPSPRNSKKPSARASSQESNNRSSSSNSRPAKTEKPKAGRSSSAGARPMPQNLQGLSMLLSGGIRKSDAPHDPTPERKAQGCRKPFRPLI